uniref:MARVEL domain-containing protein n=1 Tax=Panagrellus redivivus TaxID=6233 RepID=A0A7E4VCJ3_PANRE
MQPPHLLRSFRSKKLHNTIVRVYQRYLGRFISRGVTRSDSRVHMTSESAHVVSMGRRTPKKSNAILVKYICCGFLAFNIVYSATLLVVSPSFLKLFLDFAPFFIAFYTSIVIAAVGIYDRQYIFLIPLLVIDALFVIITLALGTYLLTNMHFCLNHREAYIAHIEDNKTSTHQFSRRFDCSLLDMYATGWDSYKISLLIAIAMFMVAIQKSVESYYLIYMQIHFYRIRNPPTTVARRQKTSRVSEIMDDGGMQHETEDEDDMVIYSKSAQEVREVAATAPPFGKKLYRSRTIT